LPRQIPTLPRGLEGGNPLCVKIFLERSLPSKRLSRLPAISVTGPRETNKSACKWQGRPSRGTPTPPGYGYLTRHLPRKITLTWVSNPATNERVRIRKTGGKETQLYITTTKCSGLGGRKRHIRIQNKLLRQNQDTRRRSRDKGILIYLPTPGHDQSCLRGGPSSLGPLRAPRGGVNR
jgi:hypothetical protein